MTELLVKIAYLVFLLQLVLNYSAVKDFHIYYISIVIYVHSNCIGSIYADLGGLMVRYLKSCATCWNFVGF